MKQVEIINNQKHCSHCDEIKSLDDFYFLPTRKRKTKYSHACKKCLSDIAKLKTKKRKSCPSCGCSILATSNHCNKCSRKTESFLSKNRETRKKNRRKNYCIDCGTKICLRAKRCIRCRSKGENNAQWKGGVTILKERIRDLFEYRQWRSDIFTRDEFTCVVCGSVGYNLNAHHIIPLNILMQKYEITILNQAISCQEMWNINNGETLCKTCHLEVHKQKGYKNE